MILRASYTSPYTKAFEGGRRILFSLLMHLIFGYLEPLVACTFAGGAIIPEIAFDSQTMLEGAQMHHANELVCVPTMTLKLIEIASSHGFDGRHLTAFFNSGGISHPSIWQQICYVFGTREVRIGYGMTETTVWTICTLQEAQKEHLLRSNGHFKFAGIAGDPSLDGVLAVYRAVYPQRGFDLPYGAAGELAAKEPIVTSGCYDKGEKTRAAFTPDGWLRPGGIGVVTEDGYVMLTGRFNET